MHQYKCGTSWALAEAGTHLKNVDNILYLRNKNRTFPVTSGENYTPYISGLAIHIL